MPSFMYLILDLMIWMGGIYLGHVPPWWESEVVRRARGNTWAPNVWTWSWHTSIFAHVSLVKISYKGKPHIKDQEVLSPRGSRMGKGVVGQLNFQILCYGWGNIELRDDRDRAWMQHFVASNPVSFFLKKIFFGSNIIGLFNSLGNR